MIERRQEKNAEEDKIVNVNALGLETLQGSHFEPQRSNLIHFRAFGPTGFDVNILFS